MAKKICFSDYLDAMEFRRDFPITCWLLEHLPGFVEEFKKLDHEFEQNAIRGVVKFDPETIDENPLR